VDKSTLQNYKIERSFEDHTSGLHSEIEAWKLNCSELTREVCELTKISKTHQISVEHSKAALAVALASAKDIPTDVNKNLQKAQEESEVYMKYWTTAKTKYQQEKISHKKAKENLELEKQNLKICQEHMQALNGEFEKVTVERDDFEKEIKNLTKTRNLLEQEIASTRFECEDNDGFSLVGKKNKKDNSKSQNSKIVHSKSQNTLNSSKSLQTITESNKTGNHACCTCVIPMQTKIETLQQESNVQTELINSMLN